MTITIRPLALALCAAAMTSTMAVPAPAQDAPAAAANERVNQVIVYGEDACPASTNGDIVVCGRLAEDERYRIPEPLRGNPNEVRRESWTNRVLAVERVGRYGTDSCSPSGLGGFTGCLNQVIGNAYAERDQVRGSDWTTAVAAERERRMRGFDAAAAEEETQAQLDERARIAREQAADEAAANVDDSPLPRPAAPANPNITPPK